MSCYLSNSAGGSHADDGGACAEVAVQRHISLKGPCRDRPPRGWPPRFSRTAKRTGYYNFFKRIGRLQTFGENMGIKVVVNVDLQVAHLVGVAVQLVGDVFGQALILAQFNSRAETDGMRGSWHTHPFKHQLLAEIPTFHVKSHLKLAETQQSAVRHFAGLSRTKSSLGDEGIDTRGKAMRGAQEDLAEAAKKGNFWFPRPQNRQKFPNSQIPKLPAFALFHAVLCNFYPFRLSGVPNLAVFCPQIGSDRDQPTIFVCPGPRLGSKIFKILSFGGSLRCEVTQPVAALATSNHSSQNAPCHHYRLFWKTLAQYWIAWIPENIHIMLEAQPFLNQSLMLSGDKREVVYTYKI
ncbi:hypothetical protein B0H19DRAFT_1068419 [Mycena capillaripes]|nr:hypothetical protein B0H19DRAFT_1068419 [Mycena capillaripes]